MIFHKEKSINDKSDNLSYVYNEYHLDDSKEVSRGRTEKSGSYRAKSNRHIEQIEFLKESVLQYLAIVSLVGVTKENIDLILHTEQT